MALRFAIGIALLLVASIAVLAGLAPDSQSRREALGLAAGAEKADAEAGRQRFLRACAGCHGEGLAGTDKGPPLLHPVYRPDHHADLAIRLAIKNGVRQHH